MNHHHLSLRTRAGTSSAQPTPISSAYTSTYPSEDDDDVTPVIRKPFLFLELPAELRTRIYRDVFSSAPAVIDLDPDNFRTIHRRFALLLVSRQVYAEACHYFYSTHSIRLFPCFPGRFFKAKKPLLARMSPRCRAAVTSLQLRLGPGWNKPPRGWVVNETLGLQDTVNVRVLKVFVVRSLPRHWIPPQHTNEAL